MSATVGEVTEAELIARIQQRLPPAPIWMTVGIGDDATVVEPERNRLEVLTGTRLVPVLVIGQNTLKGYEESTWQSALDTAGYPRTRLPNQPSGRTVSPAPEATKRPDAPDGVPDSGNK